MLTSIVNVVRILQEQLGKRELASGLDNRYFGSTRAQCHVTLDGLH
jgi:hypothetical protein